MHLVLLRADSTRAPSLILVFPRAYRRRSLSFPSLSPWSKSWPIGAPQPFYRAGFELFGALTTAPVTCSSRVFVAWLHRLILATPGGYIGAPGLGNRFFRASVCFSFAAVVCAFTISFFLL